MKIGPEIGDSLELRFSNIAHAMNARGEPIISLGLGEPDFPTPPEVIDAAAEAMRAGLTRYSNPFGLIELRQAVCAKLASENDIAARPEDILVAPGAKMALSLALGALLTPGDEVIVVTPCYPSYAPQIKIAEPDAVIRPVDLRKQDFGLDLDAIAASLGPRTRAILLNFPHNPSGRMMSAGEADALAGLLADHDCAIISDEIYERLNFSGARHVSLGARPKIAERVITINGFSKAFAMTGWRIGYLVAKGPIMQIISRLQQNMNTNTVPFIQKAALAAFDLPGDFLDDYNTRLKTNAENLRHIVSNSPGLHSPAPEGGLFAFVNIAHTGIGSDAFATGLLEEHGVAATPGIVFGSEWDDHVRISLAIAPDPFAEGVARLGAFAERLRAG